MILNNKKMKPEEVAELGKLQAKDAINSLDKDILMVSCFGRAFLQELQDFFLASRNAEIARLDSEKNALLAQFDEKIRL